MSTMSKVVLSELPQWQRLVLEEQLSAALLSWVFSWWKMKMMWEMMMK